MRGMYTANININSLVSAKTLLLLRAPSTAVLEIYSVLLSNLDSEVNEQWSVGLYRTATYGSPTGTSVTPEKQETLDSSSSATILGNLTVEPTSYSTNPLDQQGINNLSGYRYDPIPEQRPIIAPSAAIGLRLFTVPSSFNAVAQIVYREIG